MDKEIVEALRHIAGGLNGISSTNDRMLKMFESMDEELTRIKKAIYDLTHELREDLTSYKVGCALDAIESIGSYVEKLSEKLDEE